MTGAEYDNDVRCSHQYACKNASISGLVRYSTLANHDSHHPLPKYYTQCTHIQSVAMGCLYTQCRRRSRQWWTPSHQKAGRCSNAFPLLESHLFCADRPLPDPGTCILGGVARSATFPAAASLFIMQICQSRSSLVHPSLGRLYSPRRPACQSSRSPSPFQSRFTKQSLCYCRGYHHLKPKLAGCHLLLVPQWIRTIQTRICTNTTLLANFSVIALWGQACWQGSTPKSL